MRTTRKRRLLGNSATNLQLMAAYIKTQRSINFEIGAYTQHELPVTLPILMKIGQRSRSHGHIMYTAKMCHNSVLGDCILFILFTLGC